MQLIRVALLPPSLSPSLRARNTYHSMFSGVEIMDLMSDLGAYASLLYTAALTGATKIVYTIVVVFALVASLHGVHTRAIIILDMQEVNCSSVAHRHSQVISLLHHPSPLGIVGAYAVYSAGVLASAEEFTPSLKDIY